MPNFADIAFPTAVRRCFTYRIPEQLKCGMDENSKVSVPAASVRPGMRVWVPLKNQLAIGMVVHTHQEKPDFETKDIIRTLDTRPVLSDELLKLADWVHRFYYSSLGEAIQAALPAGMNFIAEPRVRLAPDCQDPPARGIELEIYDFLKDLADGTDISLNEISRHWQKKGERAIDRLAKKGLIEIWQIPKVRMKPQMETVWSWKEDPESIRELHSSHPPKWIRGLQILADLPLPATRQEILDQPEITPYVWKRIRESELLASREIPSDQVASTLPHEPESISTLNDEQRSIYTPVREAIEAQVYKRFLLYGVTGSGKTEIYIHALRDTLEKGRGGLILVPEIALTPQTVRRFYRIFGDRIAVLHSRLSDRERFDAWSSLQKGEKTIAIGARSAVFAPVRNPGLIIIDEEHDPSYKQEDPAPRYHARETAIMRAKFNNAIILTGSATPSLVSLNAAATEKCSMLKLQSRHALAELPEVNILDLKQYRSAMRGPLAVPLFLAVEEALSKKEQVILLHNRRGFSTFIQCEDCGQVLECPHCSVSLTHHRSRRHLRCHYCGYSRLMPRKCPLCDSESIGELGMGTQRVEYELQEVLPDTRILRMDQDTTSGKNAHDNILQKFGRGDADILMGTQIVAKGLDFPDVTVVGVINSDTELAFPSYRAAERMYQLLSQVAGRSGRGSKPGKVFLQTLMPEHTALHFARKHDFPGFARQEMASRRKLDYPPYSRLVKIFFRSTDAQMVARVAESFTGILIRLLPDNTVLGPSPSAITRMNNIYSWEANVKLPPEKGGQFIEHVFDRAFEIYEKEKPNSAGKVRITINVDTMH